MASLTPRLRAWKLAWHDLSREAIGSRKIAHRSEKGKFYMKTKTISVMGFMLSLGLATSGWSQADENAGASAETVPIGQAAARVSGLIGSPIKDYGGHKMGAVKDLAVDLENGRIVEVIVSQNSFW